MSNQIKKEEKRFKTQWKWGIWVSICAWFISWIILVIKLNFWTSLGFLLYGFGLSGMIIWLFVPKMILALKELEKK